MQGRASFKINWDEEGSDPVVHFSFISIVLAISPTLPF